MIMSLRDIDIKKIHHRLQSYILSEKELEENGFPLSPELCSAVHSRITDSSNIMVRTCSRCQTTYFITRRGVVISEKECIFHPGKPMCFHGVCVYSCCQRPVPSEGCECVKYHVNSLGVCDIAFVETIPSAYKSFMAYALDVEMCYTTKGLEVTRLSVLDLYGNLVLSTFVQPKNRIIDYNTRYSGVTEKDLEGCTMTLEQVQCALLRIIRRDTILIGHALHNDLRVLGLIHKCVVDTSIMFPHVEGPPLKYSLKKLALTYLQKTIQTKGHDCTEDARICVELVEYKILCDIRNSEVNKQLYYPAAMLPPSAL